MYKIGAPNNHARPGRPSKLSPSYKQYLKPPYLRKRRKSSSTLASDLKNPQVLRPQHRKCKPTELRRGRKISLQISLTNWKNISRKEWTHQILKRFILYLVIEIYFSISKYVLCFFVPHTEKWIICTSWPLPLEIK